MSATVRLKFRKCTDVTAAQRALELLAPAVSEYLERDVTLVGYGFGGASAEIVVRSRFFQGCGDLGLVRKGDCLEKVCDSDDTWKINKAFGVDSFDVAFNQYYAAAVAEAELQSQGYGCTVERDARGTVHVNAVAYG